MARRINSSITSTDVQVSQLSDKSVTITKFIEKNNLFYVVFNAISVYVLYQISGFIK